MRSSTYNIPPRVTEAFDDSLCLTIFERICRVRQFEKGVIQSIEQKEINYLVYLSFGQESVAAALSTEFHDCLIFPQHRAHDVFLTFGGSPRRLRDELMGRPEGSSQGKAGSNCLQHHANGISIFGHHGLIGENVPQAVGAALGSGKLTICFFGDGAAEEDYVLAAMGFAASQKLPVLFVCMDNNLSILTPISARRNWRLTDVARGFGLPAVDTTDDPWAVLQHARNLRQQLPALLNCYVCRWYWHAGIGVDGPPEWDRYALYRQALEDKGLARQVQIIEQESRLEMEKVWGRRV
ncbi:MAG: thiamine pyrophosphate-dependent enzyme [Desulfatitalea sp.]